jgi:hypothetical protein
MMVGLRSMIPTGLFGGVLAVVCLSAGRVVAPCIWAHAALGEQLSDDCFDVQTGRVQNGYTVNDTFVQNER